MQTSIKTLIFLFVLKSSVALSQGYIQDEVKPHYLDTSIPKETFKNPYEGLANKSAIKKDTLYKDPVKASLDSFAAAPSTVTTVVPSKSTTVSNGEVNQASFDYDKSNTDRFVKSPCYKELGFNPNLDPMDQEQKYKDCEAEKSQQSIKTVLICIALVLFMVVLVALGIKSKNS